MDKDAVLERIDELVEDEEFIRALFYYALTLENQRTPGVSSTLQE